MGVGYGEAVAEAGAAVVASEDYGAVWEELVRSLEERGTYRASVRGVRRAGDAVSWQLDSVSDVGRAGMLEVWLG